jgi:hypothetical protein
MTSTEHGWTTRRRTGETFVIFELSLNRPENANRLERRRLMAVVLDADRRPVVLNRRVVAALVARWSRRANECRDVAPYGAIGPPVGDPREKLFG